MPMERSANNPFYAIMVCLADCSVKPSNLRGKAFYCPESIIFVEPKPVPQKLGALLWRKKISQNMALAQEFQVETSCAENDRNPL